MAFLKSLKAKVSKIAEDVKTKAIMLLMKAIYLSNKGWRQFLNFAHLVAMLGMLVSLIFRPWVEVLVWMAIGVAASAFQMSLTSFKRQKEIQETFKKWGFD